MHSIDLTMTISEKLPTFPGSPKPHFIPWEEIKSDGYNLELLFLSSHTGTHLDAPYHFLGKGATIHQIPVDRLVQDALLIRVKKSPNNSITKQDILDWEAKHGKIPDCSTIVFETGWSKNICKKYYFTKNPGLSVSAAKYLVSKKTNMVGIDSPSIDSGSAADFPVHHIFAKGNILAVENLTYLEKISTVEFRFVVLPLKLYGATGSPVRAVALVL